MICSATATTRIGTFVLLVLTQGNTTPLHTHSLRKHHPLAVIETSVTPIAVPPSTAISAADVAPKPSLFVLEKAKMQAAELEATQKADVNNEAKAAAAIAAMLLAAAAAAAAGDAAAAHAVVCPPGFRHGLGNQLQDPPIKKDTITSYSGSGWERLGTTTVCPTATGCYNEATHFCELGVFEIPAVKKKNIPIFYNLFVKSESDIPRVQRIVQEQLAMARRNHRVFVHSIGIPMQCTYQKQR
jgi:hypothetical protein